LSGFCRNSIIIIVILLSVTSICPAQDTAAEEKATFEAIYAIFEAGQYADALEKFGEFIAEYPDSPLAPVAAYCRGRALLGLNRKEQALAEFNVAIEKCAYHNIKMLAISDKADALIDLNRIGPAIKLLERQLPELDDKTSRVQTLWRLGTLYNRNSDIENARKKFSEALTADPKFPDRAGIIFDSAKMEYVTQNFAAAAPLFKQLVMEYPKFTGINDAWFFLAETYNELADADSAINAYKNVISIEKDKTRLCLSRYRLGLIYQELEMYSEAIEAMTPIVGRCENTIYVVYNQSIYMLAEMYKKQNDSDSSLKYYLLFIDLGWQGPKTSLTMLEVIRLYQLKEEWLKVAETCDAYMDLNRKSSKTAEIRFIQGESYFKIGQYEKAAESLALIKEGPYHERATFMRGQALYENGKYRPAALVFNDFLTHFTKSELAVDAAYNRASALVAAGDLEKAITAFKLVTDNYQNSKWYVESLYQAGICCFKTAKNKQGREFWLKIIPMPTDTSYRAEVILSLGDMDYAAGRLDDAVKSYNRLLADYPNHQGHDEILFKLGIASFKQEKYEEAVSYLRRPATGPIPLTKGAEALYYSGLAYEHLHEYSKSIVYFHQITINYNKSPLYDQAKFKLAAMQEKIGKTEAAVNNYLDLLERTDDPGLARAAGFRLAELYYKRNDHLNAREIYIGIAERYPKHEDAPRALLNAAIIAEHVGNYEAALEDYHQVIQEYPQSNEVQEALVQSGFCLFQSGEYDKALELFGKVEAKDLKPYALYNAGRAYKALDKVKEALAAFEEVIKTDANCREALLAHLEIGNYFLINKVYDKAEAHFSQILESPDSESTAEIEFKLADVYFQMNRYDKSTELYKMIIKRNKREDRVRVSEARIKWMAEHR
jgi:tetratricopeptide (TPR) repeat protein